MREGRRREFAGFAAFAGASSEALSHVPDPNAASTFEASRLDWARRDSSEGQARLAEVRDLLALRRERIVPHLAGVGGGRHLGPKAFRPATSRRGRSAAMASVTARKAG